MRKFRVYAELLAVRALALAVMALASSVGLYVSSRGAELRAFKRARANGEFDNPAYCPTITRSDDGPLQSDELDEVSGMAVGMRNPDLFWVHNDSGDDARIFAVGRDGTLRAEVVLDGVEARDFEDISLHAGEIYVADTGNNLKRRKTVQLYVLPEPAVPSEGAPVKLHRSPRKVDITYDDGRHDVEALFVDAQGDAYLINKGHALAYLEYDGVYRVSAAELKKPRAVARRVATMRAGPVTAAAISDKALAVRNYFVVLWWPLGKGETPLQVLEKRPCYLWIRELGLQGEALAFLPDGSGFVTLSEGKHPHLLHYTYAPPSPHGR